MLKQLSIMGAALAATAATVVPTAPAEAQGWNRGGGYYDRYDRGYRDYRDYRGGDRYYRGDRGRNWDRGAARCRNDGTTGTIIGAIAGGLLGREVVGRSGDRTAGAIIGGGAGALAGRAIDRGGSRRC